MGSNMKINKNSFLAYFFHILEKLGSCLLRSSLYKGYLIAQYKSASLLEATDWFLSKAVTYKMSSVTVAMVIVL